ncbi:MAG TPA: BTAD domain-containing putative transcriptional regulator, partial [Gaiellaceae bacterium]|nr:BTAD domain-containing putative transcriptional regulator [Gaiellaceae bacterium]
MVEIGAAKERTLLVLLLLRANRFVARDRLIDELWGDHPPATARHTLEAYVSRLRRALAAAGAAGAIESEPRGYRIRVGAEELDALRFERLLEEGRSELDAGALEAAEERLAAALALWRGPALTDLADAPFATAEAERLEELRLAAIEARLEAGLGLARAAELVGELQLLVSEYPLRERLRAELMLALYRSGRQAEALAVYRDGRRRLVDELGIEPGRELQRLEQAILRHDPTLELPPTIARAAPSTPGAERRKLVTALSLEVTGATGGLDAEVLERMFERCFGRVKAVVEFHGGIVEPFVGGAAMAEFGVPVVHEDDALRACRASLEIQRVLQELGLRGRVGVCSGEVVTGASERAAIGGPVNEAARLQQAAKPGEVLIAEATLELGHGSVEVEPADPLTTATGGSLPAYRLMSVAGVEVLGPAREARFVGRVPELTLLQQFWERVLSERCCELVTIVGEAGIGKSRLVDEALRSLDARAVQSRCLPYGDGITYWPAAAVVRQLGAAPSDPLAAATIRSLLGETDRQPQTEEVAWAFRKLLEQEAPLVVVFDDIHRGEETFLDLVEGLALLSSEAALLVVCMARPELLRRRPEWPVTLRLDPLGDEQVAEMIGNRVPAGVRDRITRAAGGNPLFVVELVAMVEQTNDVHVPATLQGLLAARLDQLEEPERRVLEHAAVEGEIFHRGPLEALTPDEPHLTRRLSTLARQGLIRPGKAQIAGEDAFSFAHLLFRDAAYSAVPKAARSRLHERLAEWLVAHAQHLGEFDEIVGYHL